MKPYAMAWVNHQYRAVFDPKPIKRGKDRGKLCIKYRGNGKIVVEGKHYRKAVIEQKAILTLI